MSGKIPKIIHYCWFGGKPLPDNLQKCVDSWEKLEGYTVMRWDESNCFFNENTFISKAYTEKKYAFISDYYRLKALYEFGGIYLDTDVVINKIFDDLLNYNVFFNFILDCVVGSAIIGAEKGNTLIKTLINMYDNTIFVDGDDYPYFSERDGNVYVKGYATNNYYFTYYILKNYPNFKLNNEFQDMGDFVIFPKEMFEIGKLNNSHYAIHLCAGEWRSKSDKYDSTKEKIKRCLAKIPGLYENIQILTRMRRYRKLCKMSPFYKYYLEQKNGKPITLL